MNLVRLMAAACLLSAVSWGQLLTTTLVNNPGTSENYMVLASTSGLVAGSELYLDREAMRVYGVAGPVVSVYRGVDGTRVTSHATGATVYAGPSSLFWSTDQAGVCVEPSTLPRINVLSGLRWYCTAGAWAAQNGATGGGATIATVTGAIKGDGAGNGVAVTGTATDCVKVDGSSGACGTGGSVQVAANGGTPATARGIVDFVDGSAASFVINDTGSRIQVTASAAPGIQTKALAQSGTHLLCSAGSSSPLTCTMSPTLTTYTNGMLVNLCVTGAITGAVTLTIDTLQVGGVSPSIKSFAGTNPASGDLASGCRLVTYKSSDNTFRLPAGSATTSATTLSPMMSGKITRYSAANGWSNTNDNHFGPGMYVALTSNAALNDPTSTKPYTVGGTSSTSTWATMTARTNKKLIWSGDNWTAEWSAVYTPANATSYVATAFVGADGDATLANQFGLSAVAVGFRYEQASSVGVTDSAWMCVQKPGAGSATTASTGVSFTSGALINFRVVKSNATGLTWYINGTQVCSGFNPSITTDGAMRMMAGMSNVDASAGAQGMDWNYFYLEADK